MPVLARSYTPVRPRSGGLVHATSLRSPEVTACGRTFSGWAIARDHVTCRRCKAAMFFPVDAAVRP